MWQARHWSLANRQLVLLASTLTIIALLLGFGGAWYIAGFTERTSDRVLRASASSISETIALEDGRIVLEVPPGAFGMLEDSARDNVYYVVRHGARTITGYPDFPGYRDRRLAADTTAFRYDQYLGQKVRVATQARYVPRTTEPVIVEVAETLDEREALTSAMLLRLAALEAMLVFMAAVLIRPAIRWGLLPLTMLQQKIALRGPGQPTTQAIDADEVPQELRGLITTFNLLLSRLEEATRRIRDFTGDASHQMRTPLAALRTHLLLAMRHGVDAREGQAALQEVEAASVQLQRLLTQLLALARSEDALTASAAYACVFDMSRQVREVAAEFAPKAIAAGLDIMVEADEPVHVAGNPLIAAEMLSNIVDNSIRYSNAGGVITIRCNASGQRVIVEIEDNGPGIPAAERAAVFNRFYRLKRDQQIDGSGLGLAIVKSVADASRATVELLDGANGRGLLVRLGFHLESP